MDEPYFNPETTWHLERGEIAFDIGEIERRLGTIREDVVRLSGGLANDTYRIGSDRVLRIYRRDVNALRREKELLSRHWENFQVPHVLNSGEDFLLLEYVAHQPLQNSIAHAVAVGAAAAEIHSIRFENSGLFGDAIEVNEVWDDFPAVMEGYIRDQIVTCPDHATLFERAARWIADHQEALLQECTRPVLLHGDFKPSNLRWGSDDRLLVLDWEFAYAGPRLMDIGQLFRWNMPQPFRRNFEISYIDSGGRLPKNWDQRVSLFDLVNLVGLLSKSMMGSQQASDCCRRIEETLSCADVG